MKYFDHSVSQSVPNSHCAINNANECLVDPLAFKARQHLSPSSHRMEDSSFEFFVLFYTDFSKDLGKVNQN